LTESIGIVDRIGCVAFEFDRFGARPSSGTSVLRACEPAVGLELRRVQGIAGSTDISASSGTATCIAVVVVDGFRTVQSRSAGTLSEQWLEHAHTHTKNRK
jgi:hypothetical protein